MPLTNRMRRAHEKVILQLARWLRKNRIGRVVSTGDNGVCPPHNPRTQEQLIKSQLLSVHRRVQQSTAGTILRLKVKTVPTGQK